MDFFFDRLDVEYVSNQKGGIKANWCTRSTSRLSSSQSNKRKPIKLYETKKKVKQLVVLELNQIARKKNAASTANKVAK